MAQVNLCTVASIPGWPVIKLYINPGQSTSPTTYAALTENPTEGLTTQSGYLIMGCTSGTIEVHWDDGTTSGVETMNMYPGCYYERNWSKPTLVEVKNVSDCNVVFFKLPGNGGGL